MEQERALEIAQSIWGDAAFVEIKPYQIGVGSFRIGWKIGDHRHTIWYGDNWEDVFNVLRRCVSQPGWPDPYYPEPDKAAYIVHRLELSGFKADSEYADYNSFSREVLNASTQKIQNEIYYKLETTLTQL